MSFILNEEQEVALSEFLNRENQKICEEQILEDSIPKEFRDLIQKTIETGSPVPFFDPAVGYYSISFTPCDKGDRIYVHHHISNVSEPIYDPSLVIVTQEDVINEPEPITTLQEDVIDEIEIVNPEVVQLEDSNMNSENQNKISNIISEGDGIYFPK
jgi:hypothetical protein